MLGMSMSSSASKSLAKLSRSDLLRRASIVAGVAATNGTAFAYGRSSAKDFAPRDSRVPFFGVHQAGIATPPQAHLLFMSVDLREEGRRSFRRLMKAWTRASARMTSG